MPSPEDGERIKPYLVPAIDEGQGSATPELPVISEVSKESGRLVRAIAVFSRIRRHYLPRNDDEVWQDLPDDQRHFT